MTVLGLRNDVAAHEHGLDRALLDGRWFFKTVGVDTAKELFFQPHVVEGFDSFIPVRVNFVLLKQHPRVINALKVAALRGKQ